jgi:hypothetical protein
MSNVKAQSSKIYKAQTGKRTAFCLLAEDKMFWHWSFELHLAFGF